MGDSAKLLPSVINDRSYGGALQDGKKRNLCLALASMQQFCTWVEFWGINIGFISDMLTPS